MPNRPLRLAAPILATLMLAVACTDTTVKDGTPSSSSSSASASGTGATSPSGSTAAEGRFSGNGVSFSYPQDWRELSLSGSSASAGSEDWSETVGLDARNIVSVSKFTLGISITGSNIEAKSDSIRSQLDSLFTQAGGSLESGPTSQEMGGLPALAFTGTAKNPNGETVHSRLVLAFDGTTEYFVNCQYDDAGQEPILAGCDQVVSSFTIAG